MTGRRRARVRAVLLLAGIVALAGATSVRADEPPEAAVAARALADRTVVGGGAAAVFDPASPSFEVAAQRFVGPYVALGVRQEGGFTARGRGWHLATSAVVDVHPLAAQEPLVSPFVGVAGGALYGSGDAAGTIGPEAGVALFLSDTVLLEARWQFRWASERVGGLDREQNVAWLGVRFALPPDVDEDLIRAQQAATRAEEAATKAEEAVARFESAVEKLERAVDAWAASFEEQLRK